MNTFVLYHTKNKKDKHKNILLIKEEDKSHHCWIKDVLKLLSNQLSKHNGKRYPCERCLKRFYCQEILNEHEELCKYHKAIKIVMPKIVVLLIY